MAKRIDIDLLKIYDKELRTKAMILQRNFQYSLDDVVRWGNVKLKCTTAGKTSSTSIELADKIIGDTITDGTCVWELVDPNAGGGGTSGGSERVLSRKHLYDESTFNTASKTISLSAVNTYKYLSVTYEVTDDVDIYSNTALIETSESGEHLLTIYVDSANFAVMSAEISADDLIITSYQVANLSKYRIVSIDGIKEISAGGSSDEGGANIEDWKASTQYRVGDFVIYNATLYKCLIANIDATFTQSNWQAISDDGVTEWETNKKYAMYDLVMSDSNLYISLITHTSAIFEDDLANGKWMQINGGSSGSSGGKQVTKLGVVAPLSIDIDIPSTKLFNSPSVEVLKFASGTKDISTNALTFSVGDGSKFSVDGVVASKSPLVTFDGVVKPNHECKFKFGDTVKMVNNYYSESATIDLSDFKSVEGVMVV